MKEFFKVLKVVLGILVALCIVLFVVYFWNLDQKLMEWAYRRVNTIFDRKKTDIRFKHHPVILRSVATKDLPDKDPSLRSG